MKGVEPIKQMRDNFEKTMDELWEQMKRVNPAAESMAKTAREQRRASTDTKEETGNE